MNSKLEYVLANSVPLYRRDLHAAVGGQTQSGISPSSREPIVLLFSDPISGPQHGYIDEWGRDGFYHYTGEGQLGDQVMARGNKAIRDHSANGRELHLFQTSGKGQPISYKGQFSYVDHYDKDTPETGGGPIRRALVFRLRPLAQIDHDKPGGVKKADSNSVREVGIEASNTEKAFVDPSGERYEAERKEAKLVGDFVLWSRRGGREFKRLEIVPKGEAIPIFSDLYCKDGKQLVEAKGSVSRDAIRMAIGQLYDYRRFVDAGTSLVILLPEIPRPDLIELIRSAGITMIYRSDSEFVTKA
jgi:hypothetical protein